MTQFNNPVGWEWLAVGAVAGAIAIFASYYWARGRVKPSLRGFLALLRWVAAALIALLALASTTVLFAFGAWPGSADELVFYLPGFAALGIGTWLVAVEAPRTPRKVRPEAATGT